MPKMLSITINGLSDGAVARLQEILAAGLDARKSTRTPAQHEADEKLVGYIAGKFEEAEAPTGKNLPLSDLEVGVAKKALDVFIRTRMGRPEQAMQGITYAGVRSDGRELTVEETLQADTLLTTVAEMLTGHRNGGPGIFSDRVSNDARLAYRLIARLDGDTLREGMVDENGNTKE